ncbi:glucose-6-phosphate isomerase, partial [Myxococcota bacterium]|nr:glucose-6-phosphate isomerase [Myxococcota bacterium]
MKNINPTTTEAWKTLTSLYKKHKDLQLREVFAADPGRYERYSRQFADTFLLDFSKNLINDEILAALLQ